MEINSNSNSYEFMDTLTKPYNYIVSFTDYIYMPDANTLNNIITKISENTSKTYEFINDTIEVSINDINSMSISDITMNDINYVIYEYKIFISIMVLFSLFTIYFINILIDNYIIKINNDEKKTYMNMINTLKINNSIVENNKEHIKQNILVTKGLFIDSILEINANHNKIIEKIKIKMKLNDTNYNYYHALLRIKLKHNITMKNTGNTNFKLHNINFNKNNENNKDTNKDTTKDTTNISTSDMYMVIRFNYNYNAKNTAINLANIIVNVMNTLNYLSKDEFKNEDFVVLAISKDIPTQLNPNEFYSGLKNINYELCNIKHFTLDKENKIGFTLLLPIKQIYDLFLDVYNDIIFESTSYKIDYDNNEYWYNNSMNDML